MTLYVFFSQSLPSKSLLCFCNHTSYMHWCQEVWTERVVVLSADSDSMWHVVLTLKMYNFWCEHIAIINKSRAENGRKRLRKKHIKGGNLDLIPKTHCSCSLSLAAAYPAYEQIQTLTTESAGSWISSFQLTLLSWFVAAIGRISSSKDRYTSIECGNNTSLKETQKQLSLWETETTLTMRNSACMK